MALNEIIIKRIYDPVLESDGFRVLVDRLWPRGISKEKAAVDFWSKNVAPSSDLRKEYHQNPEEFDIFHDKYNKELQENQELDEFVKLITGKLQVGNVTFLFAAKNMEANHASILREWVQK